MNSTFKLRVGTPEEQKHCDGLWPLIRTDTALPVSVAWVDTLDTVKLLVELWNDRVSPKKVTNDTDWRVGSCCGPELSKMLDRTL